MPDQICLKIDSIKDGVLSFSTYERLPNTLHISATDKNGGTSETTVDLSCISPIYQGATASAAGVTGTVPPATSAEKDSFLKGDGTWGTPPSTPIYQGATAQAAGITGTVPAATSAQKDKFLQGDGTWEPALVDVDGEVVQSQGYHPTLSGNAVHYVEIFSLSFQGTYIDNGYERSLEYAEFAYADDILPSSFISGTSEILGTYDFESDLLDWTGVASGNDITITGFNFSAGYSGSTLLPLNVNVVDLEDSDLTHDIRHAAISNVVLPVGSSYVVSADTFDSEPLSNHPEYGSWDFIFTRDSEFVITYSVRWTSPDDVAAGEALRLTGTMSDSTTVTHDVVLPDVVHINGAETINGVKTFNAGYFGNVEALTEDQNNPGEYPVDVSHATAFTLTLDDDAEFVFSGVPANRSACFSLKLEDGGDYTVTWPSNVHWCNDTEPELTSGGTDILTFMTFDGGTNWYGTLSMTGITQ